LRRLGYEIRAVLSISEQTPHSIWWIFFIYASARIIAKTPYNRPMDTVKNPYAPGAGTPPPQLAGREDIREQARVAVLRVREKRSSKSLLLIGLRGVGKTVLLDRMREDAMAKGIHTIRIEAPESKSLPAMLAPELRVALLELSNIKRAKHLAERALGALAGFAKAFKMTYRDIELGMDFDPLPGIADNGDLEHDLQALFEEAGAAAKAADSALAIYVDELQYVEEKQLAALITALHRTAQRQLPVVMIGAGLPQLRARMGKAKSYSERLFDFPEIGPLARIPALQALTKPAEDAGVRFETDAVESILKQTMGYPYFLQEWGKHVWNAAPKSPITLADVEQASRTTVAALDASFFRVRFDRLTPLEKKYLRAMAALGPGPHRSGDIADMLKRKVTALGLPRNQLIAKGMIWSPNHGDTAFTVPLFDEFMKRVMPGDDWRE